MNHEYFEGVDWANLAQTPSPLGVIPHKIMAESAFEIRKSTSIIIKEDQNLVVREGELKKRNEYFIKQTRLFVL